MEEQTHYFWINSHGHIPWNNPFIVDRKIVGVTGNVEPINSEVLKSNNSSIDIELWNQTDMCTIAFRDESLFNNFDTSKFKKYLSIHAQGSDIKLVYLYKNGKKYGPVFQGSSINGPTAPVYNVPNISFGNEPSLQEKTVGKTNDNYNIKIVDYWGNKIDGEITDTFEEGKQLYLHTNTSGNTNKTSLIEKICNSIDFSNTNIKHKIIIYNSSCLSINHQVNTFYLVYPEWSQLFRDNYLLGIEKYAKWRNPQIELMSQRLKSLDFMLTAKKSVINRATNDLKTIKHNMEKDEMNEQNPDLKTKEEYEKDILETEKNLKKQITDVNKLNKDKIRTIQYYNSLLKDKTRSIKDLKTEKVRKSLNNPRIYIQKTRSKTKQFSNRKTFKQKSGRKSNKKFRKFGGKKSKQTKKKSRGKKK